MAKTSKITYKNISDQPQTLFGFGEIKPGKTFETDLYINNANFEVVKTSESKAKGDK